MLECIYEHTQKSNFRIIYTYLIYNLCGMWWHDIYYNFHHTINLALRTPLLTFGILMYSLFLRMRIMKKSAFKQQTKTLMFMMKVASLCLSSWFSFSGTRITNLKQAKKCSRQIHMSIIYFIIFLIYICVLYRCYHGFTKCEIVFLVGI